MANYKQHLERGSIVGLIAGVVLNLFKQHEKKQIDPNYKFDWKNLVLYGIGGAGVGAVTGVLPDMLEPATDPNHRKLFHSAATGAVVVYGMYKANTSELDHETRTVINVAGAGYLSHLVLDSDTPKGIPIL